MAFRKIFRKLIKVVKSTWLFILKTYALNLRLMKAEVIWFLLRKEKIIIITSPTSFFFLNTNSIKNLTNYAEHENTSNATWNKIHLICRFFIIIVVTKIVFQKVTFYIFIRLQCEWQKLPHRFDAWLVLTHSSLKKIDYCHQAVTIFIFRSSHQRCSVIRVVVKNFTKCTGKHLCQSLFFNKVAGLGLQLY